MKIMDVQLGFPTSVEIIWEQLLEPQMAEQAGLLS